MLEINYTQKFRLLLFLRGILQSRTFFVLADGCDKKNALHASKLRDEDTLRTAAGQAIVLAAVLFYFSLAQVNWFFNKIENGHSEAKVEPERMCTELLKEG